MKTIKLSLVLFSFFLIIRCSSDSDSKKQTTINIPTLTTKSITAIEANSASGGGFITSDGGGAITARGVVWSTNASPTVSLTTKTIDGTSAEPFLSSVSGLTAATTYYIRAYATNSAGTAYGNMLSFMTSNTTSTTVTDIDGNIYPIITIGTQVWMQKNLIVTKYRNGDPIIEVTNSSAWAVLDEGAWCYFDNLLINGTSYGKLYNGYAVKDTRGLAPMGWHVPTYEDITTLRTFLGIYPGGKMKTTEGWFSPNQYASNSSGFTGLPGGYRLSTYNDSQFLDKKNSGHWWGSQIGTLSSTLNFYRLSKSDGQLDGAGQFKNYSFGCSVRCIKD